MGSSATNFYNTIKDSYEIERLLDKLYTYASHKFDTDISNNHNQTLKLKVQNLPQRYEKVTILQNESNYY